MPEQISNLLVITGALCLFVLFWILSIVLVYWDIARRQVGGLEQIAWVALVVVLPLVGFLAYLFYRLLGVIFSPSWRSAPEKRNRVTMLKPDPSARQKGTTIPATDYINITKAEIPAQMPSTDPSREGTDRDHQYQGQTVIGLAVIGGPYKGGKYYIHQLPATVGRGPEILINLEEDRGVSRQHAEIYDQAGVIRIRDLKSTHGTQVNGFEIGDKALDSGDKIQIGNTEMIITFEILDDER